jgi:hypothetical protein
MVESWEELVDDGGLTAASGPEEPTPRGDDRCSSSGDDDEPKSGVLAIGFI